MEVICIRCKGESIRIVSVDDKVARVECLSCGKEFQAGTHAAVEAMQRAPGRKREGEGPPSRPYQRITQP